MADVIEDAVVVVGVPIRDHDKEPCQNKVDSRRVDEPSDIHQRGRWSARWLSTTSIAFQ
jgi:hypothetical protein